MLAGVYDLNLNPLNRDKVKSEKFLIVVEPSPKSKRVGEDNASFMQIEKNELQTWQQSQHGNTAVDLSDEILNTGDSVSAKISFRDPDGPSYICNDEVKGANNYTTSRNDVFILDKKVFDVREINVSMASDGFELLSLNGHINIDFDKDIYECLKPHYDDLFAKIEKVYPTATKIVLRSALARNIKEGSGDKGIGFAHSDFCCSSGFEKKKELEQNGILTNEQELVFINAWMHINHKSATSTLAFMPSKYVAAKDMVIFHVESENYRNSNYSLKNNLNHQWSYFSDLDTNELIVFKQFDSEKAKEYQNYKNVTYHSAISLSEGVDIRTSMELRIAVIF